MIKRFNSKKDRGQSVLEYILLFTAIIATLIILLGQGGAWRNLFQIFYEGNLSGVPLPELPEPEIPPPPETIDCTVGDFTVPDGDSFTAECPTNNYDEVLGVRLDCGSHHERGVGEVTATCSGGSLVVTDTCECGMNIGR